MATTSRTSNSRVEQIVKAARKYRRTIHRWECVYDAAREAFIYKITVARARSGSRGGRARALQYYELANLYPDQRQRMVKGIGCEPGVNPRI